MIFFLVSIDCSKNMHTLMGMVKVKTRSEHLACLHAYDSYVILVDTFSPCCSFSRFGPTKSVIPNYGQIKNMETREQVIRRRIQVRIFFH